MLTVQNMIDLTENAECLFIGVFDTPIKLRGIGQLADEKMGGQLTELVKAGEISAKKKSISIVHTLGMLGVKKFLFIGLGKEKELTFDLLREAFGKASKTLRASRITSLSIALDTFTTEKVDVIDAAHAFAEAFELATYKFAGYKQKEILLKRVLHPFLFLVKEIKKKLGLSLHVGRVFGKATNSARTLVNTPGNLLTSTDLANYAARFS